MDVRLLLGASSKSEKSEQVMSKQAQRINKLAQRKKTLDKLLTQIIH